MHRHSITASIIGLYLSPIIALTLYSQRFIGSSGSWKLFSLGVLLAAIGSTILFLLLTRWEQTIGKEDSPSQPKPKMMELPPTPAVDTSQEWKDRCTLLQEEVQSFQERITKLSEQEQLHKQQLEIALNELDSHKKATEELLHKKNLQVQESQQSMLDQKSLIAKHQQHIAILESKEMDLHYEIKALLQLTNLEPPPQLEPIRKESQPDFFGPSILSEEAMPYTTGEVTIRSPEEATQQLRRCLDIATKMTGAHYFGTTPSRMRDLPANNSALDLRRLFDSLRSEGSSIVVVYSQKENKMLFANHRVKDMLGWTTEKFVHAFPEICQDGWDEWKKCISLLATQPEAKVCLPLKTKAGHNISFMCHFGAIQIGLFRHHAIGILYEE